MSSPLSTGTCGGTGRYLEMGYPNGGETLNAGTDCMIQWIAGPYVNAVNLEFSRDGGTHWQRIASNVVRPASMLQSMVGDGRQT